MSEQQETFEGFAIVQIMGHSKEAGYCKTFYFGNTAMLRIDVPELPEREIILPRPEWDAKGNMIPKGAKVRKDAVQGRTPLLGMQSIFRLDPCTKEVAMAALEAMTPRPIKLLEMPAGMAPPLLEGHSGDTFGQYVCEECQMVIDENGCNCDREDADEPDEVMPI